MQKSHNISSGRLVEDFDLRDFNTFDVPSVCNGFGVFTSTREMKQLLEESGDDHYILGGGSNVLLPSRWETNVLHNRIMGKEVVEDGLHSVHVRVGAGEQWDAFTRWCIEEGFGGVENLALIPGLVGAAPIQNIGAYGVELSDVLIGLYFFDFEDGDIHWIDAKDAGLSYRDSMFKHEWKGKGCIMSIDLRLTNGSHRLETSYGAIRKFLDQRGLEEPTIEDVRTAVVHIRRSKLPDPSRLGNSGSFFKNPILSKESVEDLKSRFRHMPYYSIDDDRAKVPAGWLIEQCGWKGKRVGNVGCYEKQALVIVNYGQASSEEIIRYASEVKRSVYETFGIALEPEVNIIGQSLT